jgi:hypothetical protein
MELLDRYLAAVKKHLPWQRQDDILAELRANLESQIEDREGELGRPLTALEVEAILKQMGPPMQVAARYQTQQYLIGPALFPTYWYLLRTVLIWVAVIYAVVSAIQIAMAEPGSQQIVDAVVRVPGILIMAAAWVTGIFAAFELATARGIIKLPPGVCAMPEWSPSTLPPVEEPAGRRGKRSYAQAVAEVLFGFLALVWVLLIPSHPYLMFGPGWLYLRKLPYQLAPVWLQFYCWIIGLNLLQLGWRFVDLMQGSWRRPHPAQAIAVKVMGIIPLVLLLTVKDHALVTLKNPALDYARYGVTLDTINQYAHKAFLVILVITVLELAWNLWQLGREALRKRVAAR